MPPRGAKSSKSKRPYSAIKRTARSAGRTVKGGAKRIAATTVNKFKRVTGQARSSKTMRNTKGKKKSAATRRKRS